MDDRAQLMLIGAVVIAVAMLSLVTVLNSTIYAQNVAPGNTLDETRETNEQLQVVERDVTRITERHQERYGYVDEERLNESLQVYGGHLTEQTAWRSPAHVDVGLNRTANWTVLRHKKDGQYSNDTDFTPVGSYPGHTWTLANDVNFTGEIPFEVEAEVLGHNPGQDPAFLIEGANGTELDISIRSNEVAVFYNDSLYEIEGYTNDTVQINVTNGTVDGTPLFDINSSLDSPYDVKIEHGNQINNGSYTITVDDKAGVEDSYFNDESTDLDPFIAKAVSTAVVDVRYGTGSVSMDTQVEVTPA